MSPPTRVRFSLLLFSALLAAATTAGNDTPTAYEVLESYDFPVGLLPKGVTRYELNKETGEFKVYLDKTCRFHIQSYELEYKSIITGVISRRRLSNLKGVSVKVLFLWFSIVEVTKNDDEIEFSVGIASARFSLEGFEESPSCGCGFDCVNGGVVDDVHKNDSKMVASS